VNSRGYLLHTYKVNAKGKAKAAIIYHHGIRCHLLFDLLTKNEFGGRMNVFEGSIADKLTQLGFEIHGYDAESHGLSEGALGTGAGCYFEDGADLVKDFVHFAQMVRSQTGLPVFGMGCSMGAGIITGAARHTPPVMDGMVLVAPMISVEGVKSKPINKILIPLSEIAFKLIPTWHLVDFVKNPDEDAEASFRNDPLNDTSEKFRVAPSRGCMHYCEDLQENLAEVKVPFLTMHSKEDIFTDFASSERLLADCPLPEQDKTFLVAPEGSCHALLTEAVSKSWAMESVTSWLQKRVN